MAILTRADFQELSRTRLVDAKTLLDSGRYAGAYYLAGLAIECAIKACIARQTRRFEFPQKEKALQSYSHDLAQLLKVADLQMELDNASRSDPALAGYWTIVKDWKIESRYTRIAPQLAADLYDAASHRRNGVISWLRQHW
ncbi:MAG: HEPN domain-containing protein [Acidobacteriia bacterium]|nr:HEPN domain-containing protein [Terriglobia bacterium]